jgi:hypothetical protein
MAFITSGGASVTTSEIVDGTIVNADINAAAAIALTKLSGLIGNPGTFLSVEQTTGATHSLTTVANQRVIVIGKCDGAALGGGVAGMTLSYNGVEKDRAGFQADSDNGPDALIAFYSEVPGAGTQNITIGTFGSVTLSNQKILVIKLQESA